MQPDLSGMRLLIASPTYGPVDPMCGRQLRMAMCSACDYGARWIGDASADRVEFSRARNSAAQELLNGDGTGIVWVDSDIRQSTESIVNLLSEAKRYGADFISGVYHERLMPHFPAFYGFNKKTQAFKKVATYPKNQIIPMDACGFGFAYTSRAAIEQIAKAPGFDPQRGWFPDDRSSGGEGEDLSFCRQAMKADVQLYVHTGIIVGHLTDGKEIWPEDQITLQAEEIISSPKWGIR